MQIVKSLKEFKEFNGGNQGTNFRATEEEYLKLLALMTGDKQTPNMKHKQNRTPKNKILYGPPGTGKTYNTITEAVAIIQDKTYDEVGDVDRHLVKKDFDLLSKKKQIMFTTFHQSMSYEDFVEGIKPVIIDNAVKDNQDISYEIQGGIFKQAAARAAYKLNFCI